MTAPDHILLVDDDDLLRKRLAAYLESEGFRVRVADGGEAMRRAMSEESPDLVIVDLVMPGEDGLSLTRHVRETYSCGIIILTGKGDPVDRIVGLEMGADDYIAKPFELRELLARVRSVLRRLTAVRQPAEDAAAPRTETLRFAGLELDTGARRLRSVDGVDIHLTNAEYKLLVAFVTNPNRVMDRDRLMDAAGDRDWQPYDRSIDLHISHLRRKIEPDPKKPTLIQTMRGAGYIFTADVARGAGAD